MNEFLKTLARFLKHMNAQQKQDIIDDYREHFEAGLEDGKTRITSYNVCYTKLLR